LESRELAEKIVSILEEKKAKDLNIIDIREISILADYFVICSGTSTTHIKTLADEVEEKMLEAGIEFCIRKAITAQGGYYWITEKL